WRFRAGLVDVGVGADVGVPRRRGGPRLPLEALQGLRVLREFLGQELQRDLPPQPRVLGAVDDPHPASAELLDDAVPGNRLADHRGVYLRSRSRLVQFWMSVTGSETSSPTGTATRKRWPSAETSKCRSGSFFWRIAKSGAGLPGSKVAPVWTGTAISRWSAAR